MKKITCELLLEVIEELNKEVEKVNVLDKERRIEALEKFRGVVTNIALVVKHNKGANNGQNQTKTNRRINQSTTRI